MARRRRSSRSQGPEGCLFALLIELPITLLVSVWASNDAGAKRVAGCFLIGILLLASIMSSGMPPSAALCIVSVFIILFVFISAAVSGYQETPKKPAKEKKPELVAAQGTPVQETVVEKTAPQEIPEQSKPVNFEDQLNEIQNQAAELRETPKKASSRKKTPKKKEAENTEVIAAEKTQAETQKETQKEKEKETQTQKETQKKTRKRKSKPKEQAHVAEEAKGQAEEAPAVEEKETAPAVASEEVLQSPVISELPKEAVAEKVVKKESKQKSKKTSKKKSPTREEPVETPIIEAQGPPDDGKYYTSVRAARNAHGVPVGYRRIMIENIKETSVKECPGLIWTADENVCVLPLLVDAEIYRWPLEQIYGAVYEKMDNIEMEFHYQDMNTAKIAREFETEMPEYFLGSSGTYTGKFVLSMGLEVTNTSGRALAELLDVKFRVQDDVMRFPGRVKEIKEIYQNYVLCENKIISYDEYLSERERLLAAYRAREKDDTKYEKQMKAAKELGLF